MSKSKKQHNPIFILLGTIWIVIKFIFQFINIVIDKFLRYLNTIIVWVFKGVFHITKHGSKKVMKKSKESKKIRNKGKNIEDDYIVISEKTSPKQELEKNESEPPEKGIDHEPHYEKFRVIERKEGDFEKFREKVYGTKSTIGIILGARGTGKSALGLKVIENMYSHIGRNVCAMGFKRKDTPSWIRTIKDLSEIRNGDFVLVDEGGILFSSRDAMSDANKVLSELLLIARHKDLSVLFITQNSANLEINTIRQADYLLLKPSSLLQEDFERKKIKDIYEEAKDDFKKYKEEVGLTYLYSNYFRGFIANPLPSFWNEKVSKAFDGIEKK